MIKQNQRILNAINLLSDAILTFLSYFLAISLRFEILNGIWTVNVRSPEYIQLIVVYCLAQLLLGYIMRVYVPQRYHSAGQEIGSILFANGVCLLLLLAWLYLRRMADVSRVMIAIFYVLESSFVILKHMIVRMTMRYVRRMGFNLKHIILVGCGRQAYQYAENVRMNPQMGFQIDGYIGDREEPNLGEWYGDFSQVGEILKQHDADELIIALTMNQEPWMHQVIDAANRTGIRAKVIPQYNDFIPANPTIDVIGTTRLINLNASPLDNVANAALKRTADVILSALGIVVLSPVLLVIALGVKLSSPGPVFFVQERVGHKKKTFKMLKFRSMHVNSTADTAWSTQTDHRKTVFGSFIRKTSLDELPQLFNVLAGQMSLVGPRPEIPYHVEHFQEEIPSYLVRQQVRPGMTGWAQINGYRGDTDIGKRIEYDLWYIHNWCVRLDVEIIWRTITGAFLNRESIVRSDNEKR